MSDKSDTNPLGLGATGRFPQGKQRPDDQGELLAGMATDMEAKVIRIHFGDRPVSWLSLDAAQARTMALELLKRATKLDGQLTTVTLGSADAPGPAPLDLVQQMAEALHERAAYLLEHADAIGVRVELGGRAQNLYLSEMPAPVAIREAFRLLLRAETPHRVKRAEDAG